VDPLLTIYLNPPPYTLDTMMAPRLDNRIFWPAMAALSIFLALRNRARLSALRWSPHIIILGAYLVLAGASVLWSFKPQSSFIRFLQQAMVVTSIILPALLANRSVDLMRALFLCFAGASILNVFYVIGGDPIIVLYGDALVNIGYP